MPEALMAVLLFSLVALFMLHYLQRLANRQEDVRQYRQALTLSHQALEGYRLPSLRDRLADSMDLPAGWRLDIVVQPLAGGCTRVSAGVATARGQRATLCEWFCLPVDAKRRGGDTVDGG
ncbi:prepilin-type N-terminal cleavage/methylation domain-containing protein [Sodalis sp. C49]